MLQLVRSMDSGQQAYCKKCNLAECLDNAAASTILHYQAAHSNIFITGEFLNYNM